MLHDHRPVASVQSPRVLELTCSVIRVDLTGKLAEVHPFGAVC